MFRFWKAFEQNYSIKQFSARISLPQISILLLRLIVNSIDAVFRRVGLTF